MPRSGRLRTFISEYKESHRVGKLSFLIPFFILALELILITHSIIEHEIFVIILTSILLIISIVEIILVTLEMHEEYLQSNFDKILTIKLDDFITEKKEKNVKKIVKEFLNSNPEFNNKRSNVYHTTCQILKTHEEEKIEKELIEQLTTFVKRTKKEDVDDIIEAFVKKYPKYKSYRMEIYKKTCQLKELSINKKLK